MNTNDKSVASRKERHASENLFSTSTAKYAVLVSIVSDGYTLPQVPASHFSVGNLTERGMNA